jgi:enoyl-CoA hydratase/carnithine racemase
MTREAPAVLFHKDGGIAVVTLNRPRRLNAYSMAMRDALYEALEAVRDDPEVRVMILRGNGRSFCVGGDLTEFGTAASAVAAREARWRRDVWGLLYGLEKPTIAAVHGHVVGGGFEMALLCDLCVAADDARFFYPETAIAMIPGVAGTQTTPRLAGWGRALDLVLTGREISAAQACEWGLIAKVVPASKLQAAAMKLARATARIAPGLIHRAKRAVTQGLDSTLDSGLRLEARLAGDIRLEHGS